MKHLKILISHNKLPHIHDLMTLQCKKICSELEKKMSVEINWLIFPSEEFSTFRNSDPKIIDVSKYHNVVEILNFVQPNIVMINGSMDFHNVDIALASKYMKIPLITIFFRNFFNVVSGSKSQLIKGRGRKILSLFTFYLKQVIFMIKTLQKINFSLLNLTRFTLSYLKMIFFSYFPISNYISGDINLCSNQIWKEKLVKHGFEKSNIFVVGDPYFDSMFTEIQNYDSKSVINTEKIKILFCTTTMYGHGLCSKMEESELIINTINKILKYDDFEILLKIHPSTASREYYEKEILPRLSSNVVLYQHENLLNLITQNDVMLTYGGTGAIHYGALMRKPIVNLDFKTNVTGNNVFLDDKIIIQCKSLANLISDIQQCKNKNHFRRRCSTIY